MTPADWHASADPFALLEAAPPGARRARLFQVACLRRHLDAGDDVFRDAVNVAGLIADHRRDGAVRRQVAKAQDRLSRVGSESDRNDPAQALWAAASWALYPDSSNRWDRQTCITQTLTGISTLERAALDPLTQHTTADQSIYAALFRCLTPPPGHPAACPPHWLTSDVVGVAAAVYAGRGFHDCPVLADAFEDAGCDDAELLAHLRNPGPHARGCWPVDLALGRDLRT